MAELTINADDVRNALNDFAASYEPSGTDRTEVGRVISAADGIARVEGLPSVMANELLRFENGIQGLAQNLDAREIGVVVLGEFQEIREGMEVQRTGEILSVPVGDGFMGRVVDPLGQPIDDLGPIEAEGRRALELQAPTVTQRKSVHEPLQTGIKAIDSQTPIGRGQRQLIIGDRKTGKTAVCIDTMSDSGMVMLRSVLDIPVIGAGKASARMAEAVEAAWGPCEGLVITRHGHARPCQGIEIALAAHPVPDEAGAEVSEGMGLSSSRAFQSTGLGRS